MATILADTNELQTNQGAWATATGFATEAKQDAQDAIITETRLSELDQATAGKMANQVDIIQTDTTTDIPALIADVPTVAEFETRTPTAAQLAYIVANAGTGYPVVFTTAGGGVTTAVLDTVDGSAASATDDQYNGRLLVFTDGTLKGVVTDITNYVGGTTTATITAIPFAPTAAHNARLI